MKTTPLAQHTSHHHLTSLLTLMGFLVLSLFYFAPNGFHLFNRHLLGILPDRYFYIWSLTWWPYALAHGLNPFITKMAWAPIGFNLTKTTTMPGLGLLAAPITFTLGAITTHNVLMLLGPALAAWAMFILCRLLTQTTWPSLFAGYLYGFSSYEMAHMLGHLNLTTGIFILPLLIYLAIGYLWQYCKAHRFVALTTLALVLLFSISTETLVIYALFSGLCFCIAYRLMPLWRSALWRLAKLNLLAYSITACLVSPYLYYFFTLHTQGDVFVYHFQTDLLTLIAPTPLFWLNNSHLISLSTRITPNFAEQNAYLGLPTLLVIALFSKQYYAQSWGKLLIAISGITLILSFGGTLQVAGHTGTWLFPWHKLFQWPIIRYIQLNRLGLLLSFYAAIMLAIWLKEGNYSTYVRYGLAISCIISLLPSVHNTKQIQELMMPPAEINTPAFFSKNYYQHYLKPGENVLIIPYSFLNPHALWQAQTYFYFKIAAPLIWVKNAKPFKGSTFRAMMNNQYESLTPRQFRQFITDTDVDAIIVINSFIDKLQPICKSLALKPKKVGGVTVYRLHPLNIKAPSHADQ